MTQRKSFKKRVRLRKAEQGEKYSTARMHVVHAAASAEQVRKAARRMAEEMRATRVGWARGQKMNLDLWIRLPEVPLEEGVEKPRRPLLVVDLGALECPASEVITRGVISQQDLTDPSAAGTVFLGTIVVLSEDGRSVTYRLPPPLGTWAAGEIGYTRRGEGKFPRHVGFCKPRPGFYGAFCLPAPQPSSEELVQQRRTLQEWLSLKEIVIKDIAEPTMDGSRYEVLKAGAFFVHPSIFTTGGEESEPAAQRLSAGVSVRRRPLDITGIVCAGLDSVVLPTVTVWTLAGALQYRLPASLGGWVLDNMAFAADGNKLFPADVEFSRVGGRYTADFVGAL